MAIINLPSVFQPICNGQERIIIENELTLSQLLQTLITRYPQLKRYLLDEQGDINQFLNIYINDHDSRELSPERIITKADHIDIVTSLVGG